MKSFGLPRFWKAYADLPAAVKARARKAYQLWQDNPSHPSLHFKKVGKVWSVRIDDNHRAVADLRGDTAYWLWIGDHEGYEKMLAAVR
jgi:hypothetical protein